MYGNICYYYQVHTMNIKTEEEFLAKKEGITLDENGYVQSVFLETSNTLKAFLQKQDSEQALKYVILSALAFRSSDVHFDSVETGVSVRFRIDGVLSEVSSLSAQEYKLLLERMKYKADLKLNISELPQDGKFRIIEDEKKLDVRIATVPSVFGEGAVCRILDADNAKVGFHDLGFFWTAKRRLEQGIRKKHGLVLVVGPTGSGKTTTLYSVLHLLNTPQKKIVTLEDPIEYEIPGIVQSEVNDKKGYTFSVGLKSILRQDPDVIMVGEIRDLESATIATQAALTGHLVLATLHANSAAETIDRLADMKVPPFVLSASLEIIVSQRLVRRICPHCKESFDADEAETEMIAWMMKDIGAEAVSKAKKTAFTLFKGKGCEHCGFSGYKGRI